MTASKCENLLSEIDLRDRDEIKNLIKNKQVTYEDIVDWNDSSNEKLLNQNPYLEIATETANLVKEKQIAYGDSFGKSGEVIKILFPDGVPVEKYNDMLTIVRILDKIFRICNKKDAFGENPYNDILGYCLLAINENNKR